MVEEKNTAHTLGSGFTAVKSLWSHQHRSQLWFLLKGGIIKLHYSVKTDFQSAPMALPIPCSTILCYKYWTFHLDKLNCKFSTIDRNSQVGSYIGTLIRCGL